MYKLRPHHVFCMALFGGAGYDEAFAENMTAVITALRSGEALTVTDGPDDICASCPNLLENGGCALGGDVLDRDASVRETARLKTGEAATLRELAVRTLEDLTPDRFEDACHDCGWKKAGYCTYDALRARLTEFAR